ncbi:hypothetical protein MHBO_002717, partial [Bonamia ostreae]
ISLNLFMDQLVELSLTAKTDFHANKSGSIYKIDVICFSRTFTLFKNFKDFVEFDSILRSVFKNKNIPKLGISRNTSNSDKAAIIQSYLNGISSNTKILRSEPFQNFVELPADLRVMLLIRLSDNALYKDNDSSTPEDIVEKFLRKIDGSKFKLKELKNFEYEYFNEKPHLDKKSIIRLYKGFGMYSGLLKMCGEFGLEMNFAFNAIKLLFGLVDIEKNKDAKFYLETLCSLPENNLREMNIHEHILSERGTKIIAFKLISLIKPFKNNFLETCVSDFWCRKLYSRWQEVQQNKNKTNIRF